MQQQQQLQQQQQQQQQFRQLQRKQNQEIIDLRSQLENRSWILESNEVILTREKIGVGAYGEVRVATFRGIKVAAKCLHDLIVSDYNRALFTREMEISSRIHHPNIVQFIGATRVDNPILLYELMATSLHKRLQQGPSLKQPVIAGIGCDISAALTYLHQWKPQPIIHRDVSTPNVLLEPLGNEKWRTKLSDFGSANLQLHVKTVVPGNPAYAAPEAVNPNDHTPAMDVYSLGVLITEIVLHCPPEMEVSKRSRQAQRIEWKPVHDLVLRCINNDRKLRPSSEQLLQELRRLQ